MFSQGVLFNSKIYSDNSSADNITVVVVIFM